VVVKVLPPDLAAGVNRERFRREIKVAAGLQHPHIVPLLSAGEVAASEDGAESSLYYTMPFIEGESLRAAVVRGVRFSPRDVARILHDVVEGLAYAHARGVIHRDIKPGNVLMLGNHALVTDFGVAKALSAAQGRSGTTTWAWPSARRRTWRPSSSPRTPPPITGWTSTPRGSWRTSCCAASRRSRPRRRRPPWRRSSRACPSRSTSAAPASRPSCRP
jgi:serine/threonine protein kinase